MKFYVLSLNLDVMSVLITFLLPKKHCENILKRTILIPSHPHPPPPRSEYNNEACLHPIDLNKVWGSIPSAGQVLGKLRIPHCLGPPSHNRFLVHRSKVGSVVAVCIGAHLAKGKVKSVEHALPWSLDSKQLPLPL